jgi:hypothetical protein
MKYFKKESLISLSDNDTYILHKSFKDLNRSDKQEILSLNNRNKSTNMSINYNNNSSLKTSFNFNESNSISRNLSVRSIITKAKEDYREFTPANFINYKKPNIKDCIKIIKEDINSFNNGTFGGGVINTEASNDKINYDIMFTKRICVNRYYKIIRKEINKDYVPPQIKYKYKLNNNSPFKFKNFNTKDNKYQPYFQTRRKNDNYQTNYNTIDINYLDEPSIIYEKNNIFSSRKQTSSFNFNSDDLQMDSFYKSFLIKGSIKQRKKEIDYLYKPYFESFIGKNSYNQFQFKK